MKVNYSRTLFLEQNKLKEFCEWRDLSFTKLTKF